MSDLLTMDIDLPDPTMSLWCASCGFPHELPVEQVEMLVYALSSRLAAANGSGLGLGPGDPGVTAGAGLCLLSSIEEMQPETQSTVLQRVTLRESDYYTPPGT